MSRARKNRLEARLARASQWPLYAAITSSAFSLTAAPLPHQVPQSAPVIRAVRASMAGPTSHHVAAMASGPVINAGGVVPVYSTTNMIQPGEWVSIFGTNLAGATAFWNGDFPTQMGGTSVTINGRAAYLSYVSPTQINLQAPDDTALGMVQVVVTTSGGQATAQVKLNPASPAFLLRDSRHVAAIIMRNGSGAYGNGSYDILGPTGNCFGFPTVAARPGDLLELYGVGFGPTNPPAPAGQAFSGIGQLTQPFSLYINGISVKPAFVGLMAEGLYQINLVIP